MINILEVESSPGWAGQEIRTIRLINNLDKTKFRVFLVVQPHSELWKRRHEIDAECIPLRMPTSIYPPAIIKLAILMKRHNINLVCTHSGHDGWLGAIAGRIMKRKVIRMRHLETPITSKISYNMSHKVVADSFVVKCYLINRGVRPHKTCVISPGIDTTQYVPNRTGKLRQELGLNDNIVLIGIVAILRNAKRHDDLIEAFDKIKTSSMRLLIIGDGPQEDRLRDLIREKGLQNDVLMLGHRSDIPEILPDLDICVLPSNMESIGIALLEAESCGVPVIGSTAGGIPECIIENKTGLIFEKEDVDDLANKLEYLIYHKEEREKMGKNAREHILKNFSIQHMVEQTEKLYESVV